ncbi:hypothetical protein LBW89_04150 [Paenibacillus sp. alder61]|uniref:DUF6199 family natural product biosynthesis protein n=1 Tax=Paenibacillus sp. alder61 TaxID=2862948 RepID=UPI001CD29084|nr:DUF6199 family natural product biosynthesis protein [Paenibacillus sp. alder61]MCA1292210.1 hypothetical protein [Paenibacillus sp. alder61]
MAGFFGFLFIIMGLIAAIRPYSVWYLQLGWKFKDAEPSDLALRRERFAGFILVMVGVILLVSSCSGSVGSSDGWPARFKDKLSADRVLEINIGMTRPATLTQEETNAVIEMIQAAELSPFEPGNAYGASNTGEILFKDHTRVKLLFFGPSGGIELHPEHSEKKYVIMSENLIKWYRAHHFDDL